jgi:acetylglutamate kinase
VLQVIKVGGAALNDANWLESFADAAAVPSHATRVIVHGGGPEISQLSAQLGLSVEFHEGRRITSPAALDVTSMVLTGRINKRIVRALHARGVNAFGLSGEDGAVVTGAMLGGGALGRVGHVTEVKTSVLDTLLGAGLVPVLSPLSLGEDFEPLNINADEVATAVARALDADELLFLTDVDGVRGREGNISLLNTLEAEQLIAEEVATGGMALKLRAAVAALKAGVAKVRIGSLQMVADANAGTTIQLEEVACR